MKVMATVLAGAAAIVAVLFARSGLWIPALVFGILTCVSTIVPVSAVIKMVLISAFGMPMLLFVAYPVAGGAVALLVVLAVLVAGELKIMIRTVVLCLVCAVVAGLIMSIGNVIICGALILGMLAVAAYCIFVRIHRMKKSLQVKQVNRE